MLALLHGDGIHLVGGVAVGQHRVEVERRADRLRGVRAIARHHDNPRYSSRAQRLHGTGRLAP
jgi:hypothetical protein